MATPKQTAANRRNAQRSTGPRSDNGKARAAMNNFQHGIYAQSEIVPGEDPAQRQALQAAYLARFNPQTIEQLYLVNVLIQLHWEDTRLVKADAHLWTYGVNNAYKPEPNSVLGKAFMNNKESFNVLGRRRDANHRKYLTTLRELESLQSIPMPDDLDATEQPQAAAAQPAEPAAETPEMASNPPTPPTSASPAPEPPPHPPPGQTDSPPPAPKTFETAPKTSEMGSNPQNPTPNPSPEPGNRSQGWHPNPDHPPIDECPNCSRLGYPSPSCRYKKPKAS